MQRRAKTLATGLVLMFGTATACLGLNPGTAAAAEPLVAGNCGAAVQGTPGQPVSLNAQALVGPINEVLKGVPLLGQTLSGLVGGVVGTLGPIPIGALPDGAGTIGGSAIGSAATGALQGTPLGAIAKDVGNLLGRTCAVTVRGVNAATAPVQDGATDLGRSLQSATAPIPQLPELIPGAPTAPGPGTPGGGNPPGGGTAPGGGTTPPPGGTAPGAPAPGTTTGIGQSLTPNGLVPLYGAGSTTGRSPMADYASLPFAKAGLFTPSPGVRYGGSVPGYSPQFGILGTEDTDGVQQAGHAEALDGVGSNRIAVPVLLAVLALSGVTATLVRTWVLRRTVV
ncbi:hypothetical protein L6E12_30720 [Actinokineospora sp. PR83]|uniref:hypothetical protein n=1 Tax=Actinokineospora sp. PR83 TaxID=2884908 RepID=UPI001F2B1ABD|nr:hypothetical protein [Actinokineospora sp. PR83]MCG8920154.1 hypothetical protein [Actinokineospora sp. PR83]